VSIEAENKKVGDECKLGRRENCPSWALQARDRRYRVYTSSVTTVVRSEECQ